MLQSLSVSTEKKGGSDAHWFFYDGRLVPLEELENGKPTKEHGVCLLVSPQGNRDYQRALDAQRFSKGWNKQRKAEKAKSVELTEATCQAMAESVLLDWTNVRDNVSDEPLDGTDVQLKKTVLMHPHNDLFETVSRISDDKAEFLKAEREAAVGKSPSSSSGSDPTPPSKSKT